MLIYNENIILMKENIIQTTSFKGLIKQSIIELCGIRRAVVEFNILNNFITWNNFMKTFDIACNEWKQICINRKFLSPLGEIKSCVRNAVGNKIRFMRT